MDLLTLRGWPCAWIGVCQQKVLKESFHLLEDVVAPVPGHRRQKTAAAERNGLAGFPRRSDSHCEFVRSRCDSGTITKNRAADWMAVDQELRCLPQVANRNTLPCDQEIGVDIWELGIAQYQITVPATPDEECWPANVTNSTMRLSACNFQLDTGRPFTKVRARNGMWIVPLKRVLHHRKSPQQTPTVTLPPYQSIRQWLRRMLNRIRSPSGDSRASGAVDAASKRSWDDPVQTMWFARRNIADDPQKRQSWQ
jgi:hypothetical protein